MSKHTGTGKRRRVLVNGKCIYIIATIDEGKPHVSWTMPHENRKTPPGKRRISPYEAVEIKREIQKLVRDVSQHNF